MSEVGAAKVWAHFVAHLHAPPTNNCDTTTATTHVTDTTAATITYNQHQRNQKVPTKAKTTAQQQPKTKQKRLQKAKATTNPKQKTDTTNQHEKLTRNHHEITAYVRDNCSRNN